MINAQREKHHNYSLFLIFLILIEFVNSFLRGCGAVDMSLSILLRKGIYVIFVLNLIYILISRKNFKVRNNLVTKSIVAGVFFVVYTVLMYFIKLTNFNLTEMFNLVIWFIVLVVFYYYGFPENTSRLENIIFCFSILFAFLYAKNVIFSSIFIWNNAELVNSIYYMVALLPLTVLFKKRMMAILIQVLIAVLVINSFKTTAIIILGISFGIILVFDQNSNRSIMQRVTKFILYTLLACLLFVLALYLVNKFMNINILQIITDNFDDGGNGRTYLWSKAINTIKEGTIIQALTGFGFDFMGKTNTLSTHNDYLEVLLDFGFIGFVLFIRMLYRISVEFFCIKNSEKFMAKRLLISQILIMFMFSNMLYVSKYFLLLTALCGMLMNADKKMLRGKI